MCYSTLSISWAVVVAQSAGRSLSISEVCSSNPVIGKILALLTFSYTQAKTVQIFNITAGTCACAQKHSFQCLMNKSTAFRGDYCPSQGKVMSQSRLGKYRIKKTLITSNFTKICKYCQNLITRDCTRALCKNNQILVISLEYG